MTLKELKEKLNSNPEFRKEYAEMQDIIEVEREQAKQEERERIQQIIEIQIANLSIPARQGGYRTSVSGPAIYFLQEVLKAIKENHDQ